MILSAVPALYIVLVRSQLAALALKTSTIPSSSRLEIVVLMTTKFTISFSVSIPFFIPVLDAIPAT